MRFIMLRVAARFYQRKCSYLKSKGDPWGAAAAAHRSELLFRRLRERKK